MISANKQIATAILTLLPTFLVVVLGSCTNQKESNRPKPHAAMEGRVTYAAADSCDFLSVLQENDSTIKILSFALSRDFTMKRVPSANGVKYQGEDGFYFWTRGKEFIWGQHDSVWVQGTQKTANPSPTNTDPTVFDPDHYGHYATNFYQERDQGYDWIALSITPRNKFTVAVSVRSRADKKKPTCTFDGLASVVDQNTLVVHNDFSMELRFTSDSVWVTGKTPPDTDRMAFYCSGGGNLADTYFKISGPPDPSQVDNTEYLNTFSWDQLFFQVIVKKGKLEIRPSGLEIDNRPVTHEINGEVVHSEIGDLNIDGSPEILVYLTEGNNNYGSLVGYSVNNDKSMSGIYLPPLAESPELSQGYFGHDEFAIVENTLVRRFPLYSENQEPQPTGATRQIQYKLVDGEASRLFQVEKTMEY